MNTLIIGFMRLINFNIKLWGKPQGMGWKRWKNKQN